MLALLPKMGAQLIPKPAWADQLSNSCSTQNHLCPKWLHLSKASLSLTDTSLSQFTITTQQQALKVTEATHSALSPWQSSATSPGRDSAEKSNHVLKHQPTVLTPSLKISSKASGKSCKPSNVVDNGRNEWHLQGKKSQQVSLSRAPASRFSRMACQTNFLFHFVGCQYFL